MNRFDLGLLLFASIVASGFAADPGAEKGATRLMGSPGGGAREARTYSSFDRPDSRSRETLFAAGALGFEEAELAQVLKIYQEISGRTVLRSGALPAVKINLRTQSPLTRQEALQALDSALAMNNIATVVMGDKYVKVVPAPEAMNEAPPFIDLPPDQLPESSSYMARIVRLKRVPAQEAMAVVQPFAKMRNSIVAIRSGETLILRDYSSNIRRMLQVLEALEPAEQDK